MQPRVDLVDIQGLLNALLRTPSEVSRLVRTLPQEQLRTRPTPEEFSAVETVCHLRDIELDGYAQRISSILNETNPTLTDLDGARLAVERDYNSQELAPALKVFSDTRQKNVEKLRSLRLTDFDRTGSLEGVGEITLRRLVNMMLEHDEGHLDELRRLVRTLQI